MASNVNTVRYKQITRQARIQTREGEFTGGVNYTNSPLAAGYSKILVNYDIDSTDGSLAPRKGFQAQGVYSSINSNDSELFTFDSGFNVIIDSAVKVVDEDMAKGLNLTPYVDKVIQVLCYNTLTGTYNLVVLPELNRVQLAGSHKVPNEDGTQTFAHGAINYVRPISNGVDDPHQVSVSNLEEPSIHKQYCMHNLYFKKPTGCFAFNNTYYTFMRNAENVGKLHYFRWYSDENKPDSVIIHPNEGVSMGTTKAYDVEITPQELNPAEAATGGYNMLLENPYDFVCETGPFDIIGVLPYYPDGTITLTPVLNRTLILKCFYRAPATGTNTVRRVKWEWREVGSSEWNEIQNQEIQFGEIALEPITCSFSSAVEQCIIRVTISDPDRIVTDSYGNDIEYVEAVRSLGLNFIISADSSNKNIEAVKYDLSTAKGMLEWQNRLVLWGVQDAETIIFTSDVNNPTYFPYPNNVDVLDEPVIHCMLYGNDLIVFTASRMYRLMFDNTGITWTRELIQKNLHISEKDIPMFAMIKNMLFFKSDNYYYMLVPKSSSLAGETTIAPVSTSIKYFLDNFTVESKALLNMVYDNLFEDHANTALDHSISKLENFLVTYYSYVDNDSIILNFVYDYPGFLGDAGLPSGMSGATTDEFGWIWDLDSEYKIPEDNMYLVFSMVYDTTDYTWRFKTYMTPRILTPVYTNALAQTTYMYYTESTLSEGMQTPMFVQVVKDETLCTDNLVLSGNFSALGVVKDFSNYTLCPILKNYQYLDTGYRVLTSSVDVKKRFREVQFSLNNISQKPLTFYSAFLLDGCVRKDMRGYKTRIDYNTNNAEGPITGTLVVERPYIDPVVTPGETALDKTFVLDNTAFPELAYWKVRLDISGKGFTPRLQLLTLSEEPYALFSVNWVYRTMNSR